MNKHAIPLLFATLIILQIISLVRIGNLQNDLNNTRNQLSNSASQQSNQINNIYANIDSMLKRQASIIDSYEYSFGTLDNNTLTVPVTFNITPKETKADTSATLVVSGQSFNMNKNGTNFTATLPVRIFDAFEARIILADGGVRKTEKLEVSENLREKLLPIIHVRFEGKSTSRYSKNQGESSGIYHKAGNLSLDVKPAANNKIEGARLVIDVDGKTVSEKTIEKIGGSAIQMDEKIPVSAGQKLTIAVIATDSFGLVYKTVVDQYELNDNADPKREREPMWPDETIITDKDGAILYTPGFGRVNEQLKR
jgi:hypothetical protein